MAQIWRSLFLYDLKSKNGFSIFKGEHTSWLRLCGAEELSAFSTACTLAQSFIFLAWMPAILGASLWQRKRSFYSWNQYFRSCHAPASNCTKSKWHLCLQSFTVSYFNFFIALTLSEIAVSSIHRPVYNLSFPPSTVLFILWSAPSSVSSTSRHTTGVWRKGKNSYSRGNWEGPENGINLPQITRPCAKHTICCFLDIINPAD